MIQKETKPDNNEKRQMRSGGLFSTRRKKVIPGPRYATSGNVTMSTNGATYRFPNPFGATQVMFYGNAVRYTTAGFNLTTSTFITAPSIGAVYRKDMTPSDLLDDDYMTFTVTGVSGSTTVFAVDTNPDYPTLTTGTYVKVSGTGDVNLIVTVVAAPTVDIRADLFGVAQLRPSYYFAPQSSTSVAVAEEVQKIIQSGKFFLIVDENASASTPEYRARATETTLINIDWPTTATIVARAEVVDYGSDWFDVEVTLATNWSIQGNFVCT